MANANKASCKEDKKILNSELLKMAIKSKKIQEIGEFSIDNKILKFVNIFLQ